MTAQTLAIPTEQPLTDISAGEIMMNTDLMHQIDNMAIRMANASATIPKHLQKNEGDCWAIIMQSVQWGMNPFVVAQKTHLVNGTLGYEAQLVNAVIQNSGMISGSFKYEYVGEGAEMKCRVGAKLKGDDEITWGEWLSFSSVTTKNSPLWKTNPKQQIGYLQVKNWARLYCPGAILGVYTTDELKDSPQVERDITPTAEASDLNDMVKKPADDVTDAEIVEDEPDTADDPAAAQEQDEEPAEDSPPLTFAMVADAINKAGTDDQMAAAAAMAGEFTGQDGCEKFREELTALYKSRREALKEVGF